VGVLPATAAFVEVWPGNCSTELCGCVLAGALLQQAGERAPAILAMKY